MNKKLLALLASVWILPAMAQDACEYPPEDSVVIPDGGSATKDDMLAAQKSVKGYQASLQSYRDCLDQENAGLAEDDPAAQELKNLNNQRYDASVDAEEAVVARFNEQVRTYLANQQEEPAAQ